MRTPYSLCNSTVLYEGREELKRVEVDDAVFFALRRKLRLARYDRNFFSVLEATGEATISWNLTRHNARNDEAWVTLHAWAHDDGTHALHCVGPKADEIIDRINKAVFDKTPKWLRKKLDKERKQQLTSRKRRKRAKLKAKQARGPSPKQEKKKKIRKACKLNLLDLTPQFRKHFIFWNEALDLTTAVFSVMRSGARTARHIVASALYTSLEHHKEFDEQGNEMFPCVHYEQDGFRIQFNLVGARWRGMDLTAVTVSCTKDNRHPFYRRLRRLLRKRFGDQPTVERRQRREILAISQARIAA